MPTPHDETIQRETNRGETKLEQSEFTFLEFTSVKGLSCRWGLARRDRNVTHRGITYVGPGCSVPKLVRILVAWSRPMPAGESGPC